MRIRRAALTGGLWFFCGFFCACFFLVSAAAAQPLTLSLTDFLPGAEDVGHTRIATAPDGSMALAAEVLHNGEWRVAVQRYTPAMQPDGPVELFFACGIEWTGEYADLPEIAFHPTGHLIVLVQQNGEYHLGGVDSFQSSEIHFGLIDPSGQRIDTAPGSSDCVETFLDFDDAGGEERARMALTPAGELFVAADGFFGETNYRNVAFLVMDSDLAYIPDLHQVIPHEDELSAEALHWYPDIATNGSLLITTWHECPFIDNQGNYQDCDVGAQFASLTAAGIQPIGTNVTVNAGDPAGTVNLLASTAMDAAGNSIVVWYDERTTPNGAVFGQRFDASGEPVGGNFQISSGQRPFPFSEELPLIYTRPEVAMLADGGFMVVWTELAEDGVSGIARGRRYSAQGIPLEQPVALLGDESVSTGFPHVQPSGDSYAATWVGTLEGQPTLFIGTYGEPVAREDEEQPRRYVLEQNYPNPFNPSTNITYELPQAGPVRLSVHDLLGREVRVLVDGVRPAGRHTVRFDSGDLPSGVYLYRLDAAGMTQIRRATLLR